jgi:uncharacterized protein YoxC
MAKAPKEPADDAAAHHRDQPVSAETPIFAAETPVPVIVTDVAASEAIEEGDATAAPKRKRKLRWLWWTLAILAAVALIALSVYLIMVTNGWRNYSDELEATLENVKTTAAQDRADTAAMAARLETVEGQLETANARITELANEEANATDSQEALRNHVEAMISCADGRQELIDVLTDSRYYFPGKSNAQVERELTEFCDQVKNDYNAYLAGDS